MLQFSRLMFERFIGTQINAKHWQGAPET